MQLLRSFVPADMYDQEVPDPWYGGDNDFILTFDLIEEACVALARAACGASCRS